jgi:hypothetical protein
MAGGFAALAGALLLAACGEPAPPGASAGGSPPPAASPGPPAAPALQIAATPVVEAPLAIPAGAIYVCVVDGDGVRRVSAIELAPKVAALCAKNPEMGPCQYERAVCRSGGGRVFAADGKEITRETEAEYDRRVLRVRIRSN